jgi:hypothetical protein
MRCFVHDVFDDEEFHPMSFLGKIEEYHQETGSPIYVSIRMKFPPHSPTEEMLLSHIKTNLQPHHLDLVRYYLPKTVIKAARASHIRSHYYKYKLQVSFVEHALKQVQEHDPFFFTMDDIHESDMMMMGLLSKKVFYEEKIMALTKK